MTSKPYLFWAVVNVLLALGMGAVFDVLGFIQLGLAVIFFVLAGVTGELDFDE